MASYPWQDPSSVFLPTADRIIRGFPAGVGITDVLWPSEIEPGNPAPVNEERYAEAVYCMPLHNILMSYDNSVFHISPAKMLRRNLPRQPYDDLPLDSEDGLDSQKDGFNSVPLGNEYFGHIDMTTATKMGDMIFVASNDGYIFKIQNNGSPESPSYILHEVIDPAYLIPTSQRFGAFGIGMDSRRSNLWLIKAINSYLFIVFAGYLIILEYPAGGTTDGVLYWVSALPGFMNDPMEQYQSNSSPLIPRPYYVSFSIKNNDTEEFYNQYVDRFYNLDINMEFASDAISPNIATPKFVGDYDMGYFLIYNETTHIGQNGIYGKTDTRRIFRDFTSYPWMPQFRYCNKFEPVINISTTSSGGGGYGLPLG